MPRTLSKLTTDQLRAELQRRQKNISKLQAKRGRLLKEIGKLDRQIEDLGGQVEPVGKPRGKGKRAAKTTGPAGKPLVECIKDVLAGSKGGMRVKDIASAVQKAGYKTKAKDFYRIVAATVQGDDFKKLGRGIYTLKGAKCGKKVRKTAGEKPAAVKAAPKSSKYGQTAQQFILGLVQEMGATTAEINQAWKDAGRPGRADKTLNKMINAGKLRKRKIRGAKGSRYKAA